MNRRRLAAVAVLAAGAALVAVALLAAGTAGAAAPSPKELARLIVNTPLESERLCLVDANGGPTLPLLEALTEEVEPFRARQAPPVARAFSLFIERLARETGADRIRARVLSGVGASYTSERRAAEGESYFQEALALGESSGNREAKAMALLNLAIIHRAQGKLDLAIGELQECLEHTENVRTRANALNSTALIERTRGNLDTALHTFRQAAALFDQLGDPEPIAGVRLNLGGVYRDLGDFATALENYDKALAVAEKANVDRVTAFALNNIGSLTYERGDNERAVAALQRSLAIKERIGDRASIASTYLNLGEIERRRGHSAEAVAWYAKSLALAKEMADGVRYGSALSNFARLAVTDKRPNLALNLATRALAVGRAGDVREIIIAAATMRGEALRQLGRQDEALAALDEAVTMIEDQRAHTAFPEAQRATFLEKRLESYDGMITLLARRRPAEALRYAERAKARVLLDILSGGAATPPEKQAPLPAGTGAVEFVVMEKAALAFVVHGGKTLPPIPIDLSAAALALRVTAFRERITQRDLGVDRDASRLFQLLLGKAWPLVAGAKHLLIIPDGPLWDLPFQALRAPDGKYLVEHVAMSLAPSLSTLQQMRQLTRQRSTAPFTVVAFGNPPARDDLPPLPDAEQQVRAIARLYGKSARTYLGSEATEGRLKRESTTATILHIATHGVLNDANPMYSHLVLARDGREDGLLEGREIAKLPLRSDLVVLSACETARGAMRGGEGVIGISWALFLAGCPSSVVSQWSVDAATTTALMIRFHERLTAGATKSASMRDAALSLLRDPRTRHPFYWAPFVLIGDDAALGRGSVRPDLR
jgi:CHAT domain-containing protein/Tfp pilus assembly protein PilF